MDYAFNATALGLGGMLEHGGRTTIIPSLGSVVLPPTGGEGSAEIRNFDCDGVALGTLQTRVGGYRVAPGLYSTFSDILISNLNLFGRVRFGLLQLTLTSTRHTENPAAPEVRFEVRASYRGVRIDDEEVLPELDAEMCGCETFGQFLQKAQDDPNRMAEKLEQKVEAVTALARATSPVVRGSIVANVCTPRGSRLMQNRNRLDVPGLGRIRFGEMTLKPGHRRVHLFRLDFGDPTLESTGTDGGSLIVGSGEGNGTPVWPDS